MRHIELAGLFTLAAPRLDELPGSIELQHTGITGRSRRMSLRHADIAVCSNHNVIRLVEVLRRLVPVAALSLRSQGHQYFSLRIKLHDSVRACVGDPEIPFLVDPQAVSAGKQTLTKGTNEF